jgi:hypothetical protein
MYHESIMYPRNLYWSLPSLSFQFKSENLVWFYFVLQGGTSCLQALSAPKHQSGGGPEAFFSPLPTSDSWPRSSPEPSTWWSPRIRPTERGSIDLLATLPRGLPQQASPKSGTWRSPHIRLTWLRGPWKLPPSHLTVSRSPVPGGHPGLDQPSGALLTFWPTPPCLPQQASPKSGTWRSPHIRPTWLRGPWYPTLPGLTVSRSPVSGG